MEFSGKKDNTGLCYEMRELLYIPLRVTFILQRGSV